MASSARLSLLLACLLGMVLEARAAPVDPIFANGFEPPPPAHLIVHYPAGNHFISVRGSGGGLSWVQGTTMTRVADTFTLTLQLEAPVEWKPLLDDATYSLGPDYPIAPGQTREIWPRFTTTQGQVVELIASFQSTVLGNARPIYAYLPPTYAENTYATFPVVYMHDGQNLWAAHPELAFGGVTWQVDTAFDAAAANGTFKEAIVIGVFNTADRINEYTPTFDPDLMTGGAADTYLQMLVEELKPTVDGMLRTRPDAASTVMAGSSLGGLVTAYAGRTKANVFGRIAALSPSAWWDDDYIAGAVQSTPAAPARPLVVYVDTGDAAAEFKSDTDLLAAAYQSAGYVLGVDFQYVVQVGGQHNEAYWAQRFPGAMQFVLGPRDE